jgi:hypothetical protein
MASSTLDTSGGGAGLVELMGVVGVVDMVGMVDVAEDAVGVLMVLMALVMLVAVAAGGRLSIRQPTEAWAGRRPAARPDESTRQAE